MSAKQLFCVKLANNQVWNQVWELCQLVLSSELAGCPRVNRTFTRENKLCLCVPLLSLCACPSPSPLQPPAAGILSPPPFFHTIPSPRKKGIFRGLGGWEYLGPQTNPRQHTPKTQFVEPLARLFFFLSFLPFSPPLPTPDAIFFPRAPRPFLAGKESRSSKGKEAGQKDMSGLPPPQNSAQPWGSVEGSHSENLVEEPSYRTPNVLQNFGSQTQLFRPMQILLTFLKHYYAVVEETPFLGRMLGRGLLGTVAKRIVTIGRSWITALMNYF